MSEDRKRQIIEELGVLPHPKPPRHDFDAANLLGVIKESVGRHGHGPDGKKAHLQEMLKRDDLPPFLRGKMIVALRAHQRWERQTSRRAPP